MEAIPNSSNTSCPQCHYMVLFGDCASWWIKALKPHDDCLGGGDVRVCWGLDSLEAHEKSKRLISVCLGWLPSLGDATKHLSKQTGSRLIGYPRSSAQEVTSWNSPLINCIGNAFVSPVQRFWFNLPFLSLHHKQERFFQGINSITQRFPLLIAG